MSDEVSSEPVLGSVFRKIYLRSEKPLSDSMKARKRLSAYAARNYPSLFVDFGEEIHLQLGNDIYLGHGYNGKYFEMGRFFEKVDVGEFLSSITIIYQILEKKFKDRPFCLYWRDWVRSVFKEENLAYRVDDKGGVHPFYDISFYYAVESAIDALSDPQYSGVLKSFSDALDFLDPKNAKYKQAINSSYEALESLSGIVGKDKKITLSPKVIESILSPCVKSKAVDENERDSLSQYMTALKNIVSSGNEYRHGKGQAEIHEPSPAFAQAYVNSIAPYLRLIALAHKNL